MSKPALQKAAIDWNNPSPREPIPWHSRAKRIVRATTPTSSTRNVMNATCPTSRATFLGESGLASSSRTMRRSLKPMRRPIRSAPTVVAVMIPRPPSWISTARIACPKGVKSLAGITACNPVTVTALADSKKASTQEMPLFAAGIFNSKVPTRMSPAKARTINRGAESRGNMGTWYSPRCEGQARRLLSGGQGSGQFGYSSGVAILYAHVCTFKKIERVLDAQPVELFTEGLCPEVEVSFVGFARIEVDAFHARQSVAVFGGHPHRVPREPAFPHLLDQPPGLDVEGE